MAWTADKIKHLTKLWNKGKSTVDIARELGISKNAVVGKVHRLGLDARPSPIRTERKKQIPLQKSTTPPQNEKITLLDLKINSCRWPYGEPGSDEFHFCGKECQTGKPYCPEHCKIAYTSLRELALETAQNGKNEKSTTVSNNEQSGKIKKSSVSSKSVMTKGKSKSKTVTDEKTVRNLKETKSEAKKETVKAPKEAKSETKKKLVKVIKNALKSVNTTKGTKLVSTAKNTQEPKEASKSKTKSTTVTSHQKSTAHGTLSKEKKSTQDKVSKSSSKGKRK